jgi:hypothetical protein
MVHCISAGRDQLLGQTSVTVIREAALLSGHSHDDDGTLPHQVFFRVHIRLGRWRPDARGRLLSETAELICSDKLFCLIYDTVNS